MNTALIFHMLIICARFFLCSIGWRRQRAGQNSLFWVLCNAFGAYINLSWPERYFTIFLFEQVQVSKAVLVTVWRALAVCARCWQWKEPHGCPVGAEVRDCSMLDMTRSRQLCIALSAAHGFTSQPSWWRVRENIKDKNNLGSEKWGRFRHQGQWRRSGWPCTPGRNTHWSRWIFLRSHGGARLKRVYPEGQ